MYKILTLKDSNQLDEVDEALETVAEDEDCYYHQQHCCDHLVGVHQPRYRGQLGGRVVAEHDGEFDGEPGGELDPDLGGELDAELGGEHNVEYDGKLDAEHDFEENQVA